MFPRVLSSDYETVISTNHLLHQLQKQEDRRSWQLVKKRHILRSVHHLRRTQGTFTSGRVMEDAGISKANVSGRTVTRFLNNEGYYFMNAQQKGILSPQDLRKWVMYAKKIKGTSLSTNYMDRGYCILSGRSELCLQNQTQGPGSCPSKKRCGARNLKD